VEYPVALIEGAVEVKRAESRARVQLIDASAKQIAEQLRVDPEYARVAARKFAQKIVRERVNIDQITQIAAEELRSEPNAEAAPKEHEATPISEDWLNVFESEAAHMSSEEMQRLFGKILAGEIRKPATYSIKTIKLMAQLDNRAASLFRLLCSCSISLRTPDRDSHVIDARVVSMGNAAANSLQAYGLSFDALNILQEYGLIISDYNSYMDYRPAVAYENRVGFPATYQNAWWAFAPKAPRSNDEQLKIHGVALSRSGKELLPIVDIEPNDKYTMAMQTFLDGQGFVMTRVGK
jgi:hypothetical protein